MRLRCVSVVRRIVVEGVGVCDCPCAGVWVVVGAGVRMSRSKWSGMEYAAGLAWSPAAEVAREGRCWRWGQERW